MSVTFPYSTANNVSTRSFMIQAWMAQTSQQQEPETVNKLSTKKTAKTHPRIGKGIVCSEADKTKGRTSNSKKLKTKTEKPIESIVE